MERQIFSGNKLGKQSAAWSVFAMPNLPEVVGDEMPDCLSPRGAPATCPLSLPSMSDPWAEDENEDTNTGKSTAIKEDEVSTAVTDFVGRLAEPLESKCHGEDGAQVVGITETDTEELYDAGIIELRFQVAELIDAALVSQQVQKIVEDDWEAEEEAEDWSDAGSSVGMAEDDSTFWLDVEGKQSVERQLPSVQDVGPCSRSDFQRVLQPTHSGAAPVVAERLPCSWLPSSAPVALAMAPNEAFSPEEQERLRLSCDTDKLLCDAVAIAYAGLYERAREEACRIIQVRWRHLASRRALTKSWRDGPALRPNLYIPATLKNAVPPDTKTPTAPWDTGSKSRVRQRMRLPLPDTETSMDVAVCASTAVFRPAAAPPMPRRAALAQGPQPPSVLYRGNVSCAAEPPPPTSQMRVHANTRGTLRSRHSSTPPGYSGLSATMAMSLCKANTECFDFVNDTSVLAREHPTSPRNRKSVACSWDLMGMPRATLLSDVPVSLANVGSGRATQTPACTALEEDLGYSPVVSRTKANSNQQYTSNSWSAADAALELNINNFSLSPRSKSTRTTKLPKLNLKSLNGAPEMADVRSGKQGFPHFVLANASSLDVGLCVKGAPLGSTSWATPHSARVSNRLSIDAASPGGSLSARLPGGSVCVF